MPGSYGRTPPFIGARLNRHVVRSASGLTGALARLRYEIELEVSSRDASRLHALAGTRSIWLPNHPAPHDWLALHLLSTRLELPLHFMTAHEQLTGTRRFWLPYFGAYSIRRGGWGDPQGIRETLRVLVRSPCSLVIFPEGRCSFSRTRLMGLKPGAARIGLRMLDRLSALEGRAPDLFLVPLVLHYEFVESIEGRLEQRLARLERTLGASATRGAPRERMRVLAGHLVGRLEAVHGLAATAGQQTWSERIDALCEAVLLGLERAAHIGKPPRSGTAERACYLRQVLAVHGRHFGVTGRVAYERFYFPTLLVLLLESIGRLDAADGAGSAALVDLLHTLERIAYRDAEPRPLGRQRVTVLVGESLNLRQLLPAYRADRRGTSVRVMDLVRAQLEERMAISGQSPAVADCARSRTALMTAGMDSTVP